MIKDILVGASSEVIYKCVNDFTKKVSDRYNHEKSKELSNEGASEVVVEMMKVITEQLCKDFGRTDNILFSEEEINEMFDDSYRKNFLEHKIFLEDANLKEEMRTRFYIYVKSYFKKANEELSQFEQQVLYKQNRMAKNMNQLRIDTEEIKDLALCVNSGINHMETTVNIVKSGTEEIQRLSEKQASQLNRLCKDLDTPLIELNPLINVVIAPFDCRCHYFGNILNFLKEGEEELNDYKEIDSDASPLILSIVLQNIGRSTVHRISISNIALNLYEDYDGDKNFYRIVEIVKHKERKDCSINILPNANQKIHLAVLKKELEEDYLVSFNNQEAPYQNLELVFDLEVENIANVTDKKHTLLTHFNAKISKKEYLDQLPGEYQHDYCLRNIDE